MDDIKPQKTKEDDDSIKSEFEELVTSAEENLSYNNDEADKTALKMLRKAAELNPEDREVKRHVFLLDRIVNYKDYNYPNDDKVTESIVIQILEYFNYRDFEKIYDIIHEDFVCITRYFGRTKKPFIDSIYYERKSLMGTTSELNYYSIDGRFIPCLNLNNYGVLFLNVEDVKVIRAFEYKIGERISKDKLFRNKDEKGF